MRRETRDTPTRRHADTPTHCGIIMVPTHRQPVPDIRLETVHADTPD
jgi:hypothetical protein